MNFKYYYADNFGEGFITKEDSQFGSISGFTGNIYVTTNENWAKRVGAIEKTKEEAQAIVDSAISGLKYPSNHRRYPDQQVVITLP